MIALTQMVKEYTSDIPDFLVDLTGHAVTTGRVFYKSGGQSRVKKRVSK